MELVQKHPHALFNIPGNKGSGAGITQIPTWAESGALGGKFGVFIPFFLLLYLTSL